MPQTPKLVAGENNKKSGFDFSAVKDPKNLGLIEESDEDSDKPVKRESSKMQGNKLISPRAELAKNALAER